MVPYLKTSIAPNLLQIWILLERNGSHLMEIGSIEEALDFSVQNGIVCEMVSQGDLIFMELKNQLGLAAYYSWGEVLPGSIPSKEVWRPFLWTTGNEGVNHLLDSVQLSPRYTAHSLIKPILSLSDNTI